MNERATESWVQRHPAMPEAGAAAAVLVYAYLIVRVVPPAAYVPVNLAVGTAAILLAHTVGTSWDGLGLARARLGSGLRVGLVCTLLIAMVVGVAIAIPFSRQFFVEARFAKLGVTGVVYEVLVRIPFGTALSEELIFRGALLGLFLRRRSFLKAALLSSLVFGFWHVMPALGSLRSDAAGKFLSSTPALVGGVNATVIATGAAGLVFCWLRRRSGSVLAPVIAHAALNGVAVVGGLAVVHLLGG